MRRLRVQFPSSALQGNVDHFNKVSTYKNLISGQLPKWPKGTDCKSVVRRLRRFESFTAHLCQIPGTTSQRVCWQARLALIAQSAEHTLGKGEVMGSNLIEGSIGATVPFLSTYKETG